MHVFMGCYPGDGGLMHIQCLCNGAQYQWLHRLISMLEEFLLQFDNISGNFQQGLIAALQALDEPACLLQVIFESGVIRAAVCPSDKTCIASIYPYPGRCARIQADLPVTIELSNEYIWFHVGGFCRRNPFSRVWIQ